MPMPRGIMKAIAVELNITVCAARTAVPAGCGGVGVTGNGTPSLFPCGERGGVPSSGRTCNVAGAFTLIAFDRCGVRRGRGGGADRAGRR